jgi:GNAT superfamily N-acetyltransferase
MIKKMESEPEIKATFPVMKQLRSHLNEDQYLTAVNRQGHTGNYHVVAVIEDDNVKCVAGYRVSECLAYGRFLYVDDLVTDENSRSANYGKQLMDWLSEEAKSLGCHQLHLDSGVQRHSAHRFYLRERMDITAFHFGLAL